MPDEAPRPTPTVADLEPPLAPADVRRVLDRLLGALADAHYEGRSHGALSPRKLARTPDGLRVTGWQAGVGPEDLDFRAPEVAHGSPADPDADAWSAGAIAHWLLTGRAPVAAFAVDDEGNRWPTHGGVELVGHVAPAVAEADPLLAEAVDRLLDRRPTERPSARGARAALGPPPVVEGPDVLAPDAPSRAALAAAQARSAAEPGDDDDDAGWLNLRGRALALVIGAGVALAVGGLLLAWAASRTKLPPYPATPKPASTLPATSTLGGTATGATTGGTSAGTSAASSGGRATTTTPTGSTPAATTGAATSTAAPATTGTAPIRAASLTSWGNAVEAVLVLSEQGRAAGRTAEQSLARCAWSVGRGAARSTIANRQQALARLARVTPPARVAATQRALEQALRASIAANRRRLADSTADEAAVKQLPATSAPNDCDGYTPTSSQENAEDRRSAALKAQFVTAWNALPAAAKTTRWDVARL